MTNPITFSFHESHPVRIQLIDNEPWFCLRDVCDTLDIKVASPERFQLDQKGVTKNVTPTTGGDQELTFVNEPNLYRVIFRSNKPEAKQFQDWVFNEVLPAIRKTGHYQHPQANETPEYLNPADMQNLSRLVWLMSNNMRYKKSWGQAIYKCLRTATGTSSPQRFEVRHIPVLAAECGRIYRLVDCARRLIHDAEVMLVKRVIRNGEDADMVLAEMKASLAKIELEYLTAANGYIGKWASDQDILHFAERRPASNVHYPNAQERLGLQ